MARDTSKAYRNQIMYSVYVRNHTAQGTFQALRGDLERIRSLGTDIIWLLPIHPIGQKARKGTLGSPYAIADYRAVNPELGTLEDFRQLVADIHRLGMRCVIDVVYNHTSPDSWLAAHHPEWFYRRSDGSFGNHVGDWTDIIDLDYTQPDLWDYQIETLKYWAALVDGFRCDVAPLVPLDFWLRARAEVEKVRPGCLWLAESVERSFIAAGRAEGLPVLSDSEIFQAFDISYEYDVYPVLRQYLRGEAELRDYARALNEQETTYPENYVKLRFLENHDQPRAASLIPDERALENWTAFLFFQKGMTLLYGGQERTCAHLPSLFDRDGVDWTSGPDREERLRRLAALKRLPLLSSGAYQVDALPGELLRAVYRDGERKLVGVFSMKGVPGQAEVPVPDGRYEELAGGGEVEVQNGRVDCRGLPLVFQTA